MIKNVLSKAFEISRKNFLRLLLMSLPLLFAGMLSNLGNYSNNGLLLLFSFIFMIITAFLYLATDIGLLISKRNDSYQFKNIFEMFRHKGFTLKVIGIFFILFFMIIAVAIIGLISSIFIGIGIINVFIGNQMGIFPFVGLLISLVIVIGIFALSFIISYGLAFIFIKFYDDFLNGQDNIIYSFRNAWNLMKGYKFKLFLVNLISILIVLVLIGVFGLVLYLLSLLMSLSSLLSGILIAILIIIFVIAFIFWWIWNEMTMITFYEEINSK
ncbi:hypothetical protein GSH19_00430 [Lactobacillus sp. S2-2]|uniref:hypothetical protein n=1 Tax=Lactobacillus sp. S2-2 TaxID=2692917 RepID=UPI001F4128D1|nr:hypothetical protein [Lactobacillus sp. S2-2]MCF6514652.1 hypothetical protein [Lactobacillus sp. S2-2]